MKEIFKFINKDAISENETRRGIVTLRLLYIIQILVFALNTTVAGPEVMLGYTESQDLWQ